MDELPAEPEPEPEPSPELVFDAEHIGAELVEAYSGNRADSVLIGSVLGGSGIDSALWGTGTTYLPETGARLNAVRVMVRPAELERAVDVIDDATSPRVGDELPFDADIAWCARPGPRAGDRVGGPDHVRLRGRLASG